MERVLGTIGAGNMAGAILSGILDKDLLPADRVWLSCRTASKLTPWREKGVRTTLDNVVVAENADVVMLAVKPQNYDEVLEQIAPVGAGRCILSIAAGITTDYIRSRVPGALVVRAMPNTPLRVGRGATAVAAAPDVPPELFDWVCALFGAAGEVAVIPESQMDDVIAVSGSSPAFFFRMAAAMVAEAQAAGMDPSVALRLAAKTMEGAAAMLLESGQSAQELTRQVCSPGGTTLAALSAFDDYHFEDLYHEAALRCAKRSKELAR